MGFYINHNSNGVSLPARDKADYLILDGGTEISEPKQWVPNLVCVVENEMFDAAGYVYSEDELIAFTNPHDYRPKQWIIYPRAAELSGYTE